MSVWRMSCSSANLRGGFRALLEFKSAWSGIIPRLQSFLGARDERGMHFSYPACVEAFAQAILSNNEKYITMQGL
jgi:hypothetical protein